VASGGVVEKAAGGDMGSTGETGVTGVTGVLRLGEVGPSKIEDAGL